MGFLSKIKNYELDHVEKLSTGYIIPKYTENTLKMKTTTSKLN